MAAVVLAAIMAAQPDTKPVVTAVVMAAVAAQQLAPITMPVTDVLAQSGLYGGREEVTPQQTREMYKCHISHK
jgi:hypothetical protein